MSQNGRERERLAALAQLEFLDKPAEPEFDILVRLTQNTLHCKIAMISVIDQTRQLIKACCGLDVTEAPREGSFCAQVAETEKPLIVADTHADPLFANNPYVVGPPYVRFYAGVPLRARIKYPYARSVPIGTLCVIDDSPRTIAAQGLKQLHDLALLAESLIEARFLAKSAGNLAQERQTNIQLLAREQRQFKQAEGMANIGSWRLTLADQRSEWSDQVFTIHELPIGDKPKLETALNFYPPHARALISAAVSQTIATGEPFDVETDFITAKGHERRVRSMGEVEFVDGQPIAIIGVFQDVTAQYNLQQSLRHIANTDDLTQIPNRARFNQVLDDKIAAAKAANEDLALLLIDLDGFKMVNDRCGHLAGDELLRLVGSRLRVAYLSKCFVARLGGDEFVVIVSAHEDCAHLDKIVTKLLADLRHSVGPSDDAMTVSGTIGIAWLDATVLTRSDLMHRADMALYQAKNDRRGSAKAFVSEAPARARAFRA